MLAMHKANPSLVLNDSEMAIVAEVKYLGVIVVSRLNFTFARPLRKHLSDLTLNINALYLETFLQFCVLLKYTFCPL